MLFVLFDSLRSESEFLPVLACFLCFFLSSFIFFNFFTFLVRFEEYPREDTPNPFDTLEDELLRFSFPFAKPSLDCVLAANGVVADC